jgi:iron complex transport system substrate-binding protein
LSLARILLYLSLLQLAPTAVAAGAREIVDDTGRRVTVPAVASRVVSLDDVSLTVPLLELGAIPIASEGRIDENGERFIRSSRTVTGLDFGNTGMVFLGRNPVDVETLVTLKPDLIVILKSRSTPVGHLQAVAPTVVIDDVKRSSQEIYALLAELTGTTDRLAMLHSRYEAQVEQLRRIVASRRRVTVSILNATEDGKIAVEHTYGSLGAIARDAGVVFPPLVDRIAPNTGVDFSPEALPDLDADIIFDTYRNDKDETARDARERMRTILPDYCRFLRACREGRYYVVPRDEAKSISYAARMMAVSMMTAIISTLEHEGGD